MKVENLGEAGDYSSALHRSLELDQQDQQEEPYLILHSGSENHTMFYLSGSKTHLDGYLQYALSLLGADEHTPVADRAGMRVFSLRINSDEAMSRLTAPSQPE